MSSGRLVVVVSVGLVLLTLLAYGPVWDNDFINLDDAPFILDNPGVRDGLTLRNLTWAWTTFYEGCWMPLSWMSLQVDADVSAWLQGSGKRIPLAPIFHGQNLLWHTATVLLLFAVLRRMTGALWRSALVAALFAVHPLHVESVAWASERKDVLSAFFWVLTLLAYHRYTQRPHFGRYLLVVVPFVLGLLAKPMLVTLPCVLLLLDFWPLQRWRWGRPAGLPAEMAGQQPCSTSWLLLEKTPLFLLALGVSIVAFLSQHSAGAIETGEQISWPARLANVPVSYVWYLKTTFWPNGLSAFYQHPRDHWNWGPVLASVTVLLLITVVAGLSVRSWPWLLVGWLWFLGTLVPVIGLVQIGEQARADRYTYIPHIGLFLALVWSAAALGERLRVFWVQVVSLAGLSNACLLLAMATWVRVGHWRSSETLWKQAVLVDPSNAFAHYLLACSFIPGPAVKARDVDRLRARRHLEDAVACQPTAQLYLSQLVLVLKDLGQTEEAIKHLKVLVEQDPNNGPAWQMLGSIQRLRGQFTEAVESLTQAVRYQPTVAAHTDLGLALWQLHRYQEAEQQFLAALQLEPNEPPALTGLGQVLLRQGRTEEAAKRFAAAVQSDPRRADAWNLRGVALGRLGKWAEARLSQQEAVRHEEWRLQNRLAPGPVDLARYHGWLAAALDALGRKDQARQAYEQARQLDPGWPRTTLVEARRLATSSNPDERDPQTALELASQVCQTTPEPSADALDVFAAAQAALGRYPEAARTARQALRCATPGQVADLTARLRLYEENKPFVRQER